MLRFAGALLVERCTLRCADHALEHLCHPLVSLVAAGAMAPGAPGADADALSDAARARRCAPSARRSSPAELIRPLRRSPIVAQESDRCVEIRPLRMNPIDVQESDRCAGLNPILVAVLRSLL